MRDLEKDRLNERKQKSPLVTGALSARKAAMAAAICAVLLAFSIAFWFGVLGGGLSIKPRGALLAILGLYLTLNLFYSLGLKKIPIVDVSIIAAGFMLRFLFGTLLVGGVNSEWFFLIILAGSFYMSFGKRRNEAQNGGALYSYDFLDRNMYVCQALCVVFYTLWCIDPITVSRLNAPSLIWTVPLVLLILFRYSYNIEKNKGGDPTTVLLNDKALVVLCTVFLIAILYMVYIKRMI
jgi:4-hydroxybenzoate polyprenyltransferase